MHSIKPTSFSLANQSILFFTLQKVCLRVAVGFSELTDIVCGLQEKAPKDKAKRPRPKLSTSLFGQPESIADVEPKDARQWEMSDSDSD